MAIIDGKLIAQSIREKIAADVEALLKKGKRAPGLCTILVGDDPASHVYIRNKNNAVKQCHMHSVHHHLPATVSQAELLQHIEAANHDAKIDGILVQLPLPKHIDADVIVKSISPLKDVDGFHPENAGLLSQGKPRFVPCTPKGCLVLLEKSGVELRGKHVVVVGRSNIVGKPMADLLLAADATVTVCHRYTDNLQHFTKQADILVCAVGKPGLISADCLKKGVVVLDVGITRGKDAKLYGDVDTAACVSKAAFITPVPGGVGPMTIAMLLQNTLQAYEL